MCNLIEINTLVVFVAFSNIYLSNQLMSDSFVKLFPSTLG